MRDLVFVEGGGKINDETKEKLGFLNVTSNSIAGCDEIGGFQDKFPRLNTINEAMDSTGKWLKVFMKNSMYFHAFEQFIQMHFLAMPLCVTCGRLFLI